MTLLRKWKKENSMQFVWERTWEIIGLNKIALRNDWKFNNISVTDDKRIILVYLCCFITDYIVQWSTLMCFLTRIFVLIFPVLLKVEMGKKYENPKFYAHREVYSIQLYVIKFVSDLRQVGVFSPGHSGFLHQ